MHRPSQSFEESFYQLHSRVALKKLDTIKRLGFELLYKVAMLFSFVFWDSNVDIFGHGIDDSLYRGEFFLF